MTVESSGIKVAVLGQVGAHGTNLSLSKQFELDSRSWKRPEQKTGVAVPVQLRDSYTSPPEILFET